MDIESDFQCKESQDLRDFQAKIFAKCDVSFSPELIAIAYFMRFFFLFISSSSSSELQTYRSASRKESEKLASTKTALHADFSAKTPEDLQREISKYKQELEQYESETHS